MRNRFDRQLVQLNNELIEMGGMIEKAISDTVKALVNQDIELASNVIEYDEEIDHQEREIEQLCLKLLLQQQPVAKDLRLISAALKMITDMERIGDHATDISEITIELSKESYIKKLDHIQQMAKETMVMLVQSVEAFVNKDMDKARAVIVHDDVVDDLFNKVKAELIANSITAAELSVSTLSAISANLGTVTAGVLKSSNYVANSTGMMLNLATGTWDSKYFKISSTGGITSTSGKIACWDITSEAFKNDYLAPDGYLRRVYIQGSKNTGDWIFSIQKGATQGASPSTLNSLWHVTNDGEMSFNVESGKGIKMYGLAGLEVSVLRDGIELSDIHPQTHH